jgi:cytochrome c5
MNIVLIAASLLLIPPALGGGLPQHTVDTARKAASAPPTRTGEQVFAANCSRCHQAPTSLSPRVTGTAIMHMRMRARLSSEDERTLLKYLAP